MSSSPIASAWVELVPEMRGFQRALQSQIGDATRPMENASRSFVGTMGRTVAGATLAVGAAVAGVGVAVGAIALRGGLDRALAIEQAEAKLTGLGHSADSVASIMENALGAVRGTAFGLGDAAGVAATIVASGVRPGQQLEDTLRLVADAATIAGTDMGSMGAIFSKVAASNKLQMDTINQLHDAGIPALQLVADEMGVTAEEASRMASRGEIDFATFSAAMEGGLGGAALSAGETFSGAMANVRAALGRLGAEVWNPVLAAATPVLGNLQGLIDDLGISLEMPLDGWASAVEAAFGRVDSAITFLRNGLQGGFDFSSFGGVIGPLAEFSPVFTALASAVQDNWPAIRDALKEFSDALGGALGDALEAILPVLPDLSMALVDLLIALLPLIPPLVDLLAALLPLLPPVVDLAAQIVNLLVPALQWLVDTIAPAIEWFADLITRLDELETLLHDFGFPGAETTVEQLDSVAAALDRVLNMFGISLEGIRSWRQDLEATISGAVKTAKNEFDSIVTSVQKTFANAPSILVQAGRDIVQGLVDGIRQRFPFVDSVARALAGTAIGSAKSALGINSPSRVFRELGGFTGEGFLLGLGDKSGAVASAMDSMIAVPAASRANPVGGAVVGGTGGGVNLTIETSQAMDEYLVGEVAANAVARVLR